MMKTVNGSRKHESAKAPTPGERLAVRVMMVALILAVAAAGIACVQAILRLIGGQG